MLLLHSPKICIQLPNKVGSTSIVRAANRVGKGELVTGPMFNVDDSPHVSEPLDSSWTVIGPVRSPFRRALSLWRHDVVAGHSSHDFPDFVIRR